MRSRNSKVWRPMQGLVLICMLVCMSILPAEAAPVGNGEEIVILHTNDVHCGLDDAIGYAGLAAYKAEMEEQYGTGNVTLVDAGDSIQGGAVGTLSKGSYIIDLMNQLGYRIAVPGNHEFDYGVDRFLELTHAAQFPYLCSNFVDLTDGRDVLPGFEVLSYGDISVGFVGISTPETYVKSTPTYFQDASGALIYGFRQGGNGQELYTAVQNAVDAARAQGADYVVAIGHLGSSGSTSEWTAEAVIAATTGIDVMIDGHSHEQYERNVKNLEGQKVLLAQTGTKLNAIGKVIIHPSDGQITAELVQGYEKKDPAVTMAVNAVKAQLEQRLSQEVGYSEVDLVTNDPVDDAFLIRSRETNLGNFCADAYRAAMGADIAVVNGGSVRKAVPAGNITYGELLDLHPYSNALCLIEISGQKILDMLEMGARLSPEPNGGFLQVSGLTYTINTAVPSPVILNDNMEYVGIEGARRVSDVKVAGTVLDPAKTYTLASHNYMLKQGGDGYTMFRDCKVLQDETVLDNQALINYMSETLNGKVGQEYVNPYGQGRITVVNQAVQAYEETISPEAVSAVYIVRKGDCLWAIAKNNLGDGSLWTDIYLNNQDVISNPKTIYAGMKLKMNG